MSERIDNIIKKCKENPDILDFVENAISMYEQKKVNYEAEIDKEFGALYRYQLASWDTELFSENLADLSIAILGQGEFQISDLEVVTLTLENADKIYYLQDDWCKAEKQMLHSMYQMLDQDLRETVLHRLCLMLYLAKKATSLQIHTVLFYSNIIYGLFVPLDENFVLSIPPQHPENQ